MSDDKGKTGPEDAARISISEPYEVRYWTETFGVSEEVLRRAVETVGNSADTVRAHLTRGSH